MISQRVTVNTKPSDVVDHVKACSNEANIVAPTVLQDVARKFEASLNSSQHHST